MRSEAYPRERSKGDRALGIVLALATVATVSLLGIASMVMVPALAAVALMTSWGWKNAILRTFAVTLTTLTLLAIAAYFMAYAPYVLGALLESVF